MTKWVSVEKHDREVARIKRDGRKKLQRLERENTALLREREKYRLEAERHGDAARALEAKLAGLEEEAAQARGMWSTPRDGASEWEMGDAPADAGAVAAHAEEVIGAILRGRNITREEWRPAPGIETIIARLAAGPAKGAKGAKGAGGPRRPGRAPPRNSQ